MKKNVDNIKIPENMEWTPKISDMWTGYNKAMDDIISKLK